VHNYFENLSVEFVDSVEYIFHIIDWFLTFRHNRYCNNASLWCKINQKKALLQFL